jgi:hypothetical protein
MRLCLESWHRASLPLIHGLGNQRLGGAFKHRIRGFAIDELFTDFEHHRDGQRRDALQMTVGDSTLYSGQHIRQPPDIRHPARRISPGRAQQNMIGLMLTQHVIDQVGVDVG